MVAGESSAQRGEDRSGEHGEHDVEVRVQLLAALAAANVNCESVYSAGPVSQCRSLARDPVTHPYVWPSAEIGPAGSSDPIGAEEGVTLMVNGSLVLPWVSEVAGTLILMTQVATS